MEAENHAALRQNPAGAALENFLAAAAHGNETALSGAFGLEGKFSGFPGEGAGQKILQSDPPVGAVIVFFGKSCHLRRHMDAHVRGRGEGIALYMVDGQDISPELVTARRVLVGGIALMVDAVQ